MSKPVVGVQMYTLRNHAKSAGDLEKTFHRIREIGYTTAQVSGIGADIDPADVARFAKDAGVAIATTHMGWGQFQKDLDEVIAIHKMWDCIHPAVGGVPGEYFAEGGAQRFIEELKPIAERLAAEGMDFSYHNHNHEFARFGGRTWLGQLYEDGPAEVVKAELDTYWVTAGGGNPEAWIRKCSGRMPILHLKDMCIAEGREQRFAPIGEGNLDWAGILPAAAEAGAEYFMVEQDNCYDIDPFEALAISYRNLKAMGWE